jgi:hypothetical protein
MITGVTKTSDVTFSDTPLNSANVAFVVIAVEVFISQTDVN